MLLVHKSNVLFLRDWWCNFLNNGLIVSIVPLLVTFEDKRQENFMKGQAELERRRELLRQEQKKMEEERLAHERAEAERRERVR